MEVVGLDGDLGQLEGVVLVELDGYGYLGVVGAWDGDDELVVAPGAVVVGQGLQLIWEYAFEPF